MTDTHTQQRREASHDATGPSGPARRPRGAGARPPKTLDPRLEDALRKAYARDDFRIHGVASASVLALARLGLAEVVARGRYEHYALSRAGEQRAAELTRALLARRGQVAAPSAAGMTAANATPDLAEKAALCDRLVAFLADPGSGSLTIDLPSAGAVPAGGRVKIERCGPSKLVISILQPPGGP